MSGPEVHPGNVPSRPGGDHRGGLHDQNCGDRGGEDQTADLGHGRPGEVRLVRGEERMVHGPTLISAPGSGASPSPTTGLPTP